VGEVQFDEPLLRVHSMTTSSASKPGNIHILEEQVDEAYEPTDEELKEYAEWLGMDPARDLDFLWIARKGLKTPLPPPWQPCEAASGDIFFHNPETGESQWDHPCDGELRKLYAAEKAKCKQPKLEEAPETPGTPCDLASVSSIAEESSPQRLEGLEGLEDFDKTPSPEVKAAKAANLPSLGLAALAASTAKANEGKSTAGDVNRLVPERPSRPPPAKLRPPRPKPSPLERLDPDDWGLSTAFCRSPSSQSPERSQEQSQKPGKLPSLDGERVLPGDAQSPPTPRLSAVLTAELCGEPDPADQISLWSRLEDGEETLSQAPAKPRDSSTHSSKNLEDGDSLEISSLTAVLEQSNEVNGSSQSAGDWQTKPKPGESRSPASPWLDSPETAGLAKLRQLRKQLESSEKVSEDSSHTKSEILKDEAQSQEKPVQDSTTQTEDTTASTSEAEQFAKAVEWPRISQAVAKDSPKLSQNDSFPPTSLEADALAVQQSMACLAAELNAAAVRKQIEKKVPDIAADGGRILKDITNEVRDGFTEGSKLPTPRSVANLMDIANMRLQCELQEQQRSALERQLDECLSAASMEQASHAATKAALRESQREVLRLQSQVQFKDAETQRLELELQRCQSELAALSAQAQHAQVQLKAQQAELGQVKAKLRDTNNDPRPSYTRSHAALSSLSPANTVQDPRALSELIAEDRDNPTALRQPGSSHRSTSGARLGSEVSEALRKRRRELRRKHAELEQERRQWRQDARSIRRSRSADGVQAEDLVRARAALDARASALNQSICEYRALQRALTSGSLHPQEDH